MSDQNNLIHTVIPALMHYCQLEEFSYKAYKTEVIDIYAQKSVELGLKLTSINHIKNLDAILHQLATQWLSNQLDQLQHKESQLYKYQEKKIYLKYEHIKNSDFIHNLDLMLKEAISMHALAKVEADKRLIFEHFTSQYESLDDGTLEQIIMDVYGGFFSHGSQVMNARLILGWIKQLKASLIGHYSSAPYALIFYGPNRIGKSRFIDSLRQSLTAVETYNVLASKLEFESFGRSPIWGSNVLLYANELGYESRADERKLKELITYEILKYSPFYINEQFDIPSIANVVLSSNFDPNERLFVGAERRRGVVYMQESNLLSKEELNLAGYAHYNDYIDDFVTFLLHSTSINNLDLYASKNAQYILRQQHEQASQDYLATLLTQEILEHFLSDWIDKKNRLKRDMLIHYLKDIGYYQQHNFKQMQHKLKQELIHLGLIDGLWTIKKKVVKKWLCYRKNNENTPMEKIQEQNHHNHVVSFPHKPKIEHISQIPANFKEATKGIFDENL